ncbi:E3 ubiquitin-protein ligase TRIM39-like isoform X3 [Motacilla alba alba]|uniref:E3 ubiquitin-protein ligase TRIM39-like isoform X3 n=1 Tax=Motacilla alba alba TaxID=1094192 RepID=UPI0018D4ECF1|nr:E3 ubiquitin-protein ligase TRIM39-like isoform X3 [Motacilla alba alba]XP_038013083.1 E3 ubiquitin-protein ligase TRIM39-like isoform X3 [Motacilla alba alba]
MQKYCGQTSVPRDLFDTGNVSLTLKSVQPADEGMYSCTVISRDWIVDMTTKLNIAGASQWVPASWIQLPLFLLTLAAGAVLVFRGRRVDCQETVWLKNHQHLYQKIQTLQEAFYNEQKSTRRDIQLLRTDLENELGLTIEANTTNTLESMWKKDLHEVSQQVQTLQKAFQNNQLYTQRDLQMIRTDLKDELGRTVEANVTGNIANMWQKDLLHLSQQIQTLKQTFQNMKVSIQRDLQMIRTDLENKLGGTVEAKTSTLESRLEKDHHEASQQIQILQENFQNRYETTQHDLQMIRTDLQHHLARTVEANTRTMESMWKKDLLQLSQQMQTLQEAFQNMEGSTQCDLQMIRADMKNELGRRVKENTARVLESIRLMDIQQLSQEIQTLEKTLQTTLGSTKYDLDLPVLRSYKGDVILDADTAHPRLEISADGRTVKDTGVIRFLLRNEKRFDSHLFVLAKEGYTSGKHYWEVNVGTRRNWALGIACESVTRKGTLTLCPENGFWVIAYVDGQDYLACTNPWTCLTVTGYLSKIGIFLDIPAKKVSFYDVFKAVALYTLSIADGSIQEGKFLPFFSTGLAAAEPDTEPLAIMQFSDDDE